VIVLIEEKRLIVAVLSKDFETEKNHESDNLKWIEQHVKSIKRLTGGNKVVIIHPDGYKVQSFLDIVSGIINPARLDKNSRLSLSCGYSEITQKTNCILVDYKEEDCTLFLVFYCDKNGAPKIIDQDPYKGWSLTSTVRARGFIWAEYLPEVL